MESLPCKTVVFRAITRKQWVDKPTQAVSPGAFFRRPPPDDEDGISVDIDSPTSCVKIFNKTFGVVSLHVGRVRDIGLDITVDDPPHANIVGVPRKEEDNTEAERFASQLAKMARFISQGEIG